MEKNRVQSLFKQQIYADSIIQLKKGKILLYYFKDSYYIRIYNEKTFHKILDINLYKPIEEYENKNEKNKFVVKEYNSKEKLKLI